MRKAAQWIEKIPPMADGRVLELSLLTSKNVPDIDEEYDATIVQATIEQEDSETIERIQEEVRISEVPPVPKMHKESQTSTPKQSAYVPPDKRRVTFDQTTHHNWWEARGQTFTANKTRGRKWGL